MMPRILCRFALLVALLGAQGAWADIAVIVHPSNPLTAMSTKEVADIYLGRTRVFSSGEYALAFDQARESTLRGAFFQKLTGMTLQQANTYWSRLMFTGQMLPPTPLPDEAAAVEVVRRNPGAIAYVRATAVTSSVRTVLTLKE
jgi:ABC-type phosphate transport system substrate-binding protein